MKAADVAPLSAVHAVADAGDAKRAAPDPVRVCFDRFELDEANALLLCDGKGITLAPRPFAVLCALARRPGSLLTKNALLDEVWGHQFVSDSVLKTTISDLRMLLGDDPRNPRYIQTVSRRGYRFIAATTAIAAAPSGRTEVPAMKAPQQRARSIVISMGEIGCEIPRPAFATMEGVLRAQQLWLQLRALSLGQLSPAAAPLAFGAD